MSDQTPTTSRADGNKAARRTRRQLLVGGTGAMAAALTAEAFIRPTAAMAAAADELFTYNGTPAAGTLVASVAAESATDQFGNSYLSGETAYAPVGGGFIACQNNGGAVTFYTAASEAGPWAALPQLTAQAVASGSGILEFGAGVGPGIAVVGPTGDMTGGKDQKNIQQALGAFLSVVLLPGTFYLGKPVTMTSQNQVLSGCGLSTILQEPTSGSFSGSALIMPSASSQRVTNLQFSTKAASFIDFANAFMFYFECDHITGTAGPVPPTFSPGESAPIPFPRPEPDSKQSSQEHLDYDRHHRCERLHLGQLVTCGERRDVGKTHRTRHQYHGCRTGIRRCYPIRELVLRQYAGHDRCQYR